MLTRSPIGQSMAFHTLPSATDHSRANAAKGRPSERGLDLNDLCKNLTARQREVLAVMMQGKSNKGICRALNLAEPTVKNHVTAILRTLNVTNRTEAVLKVTKASTTSMSYVYTISGYPIFGQR